jgi:hypothetical protein
MPLMRYTPFASVVALRSSRSSRYSWTVQPSRMRSFASRVRLKFASCHALPFRMPWPGMAPTSIATLALAVRGGLSHVTVPVFTIRVPSSRSGLMTARNRSVTTPCGCSGP